MKILIVTARHTWAWLLRLGIVLFLLIALLITSGRWLLPQAANYRADLEQRLSHYLHRPVRIQSLNAGWLGWEPVLRVDGLSLIDPEKGVPLVSFDQVLVRIDLPRSLLAGQPVLGNVRLQGLRLMVERDADGGLRLLDRIQRGPPIAMQELVAWLFAIRSLDLSDAEVVVRDAGGGLPPLVFSRLRLSLREGVSAKYLGLAVDLPESLGKRLQGVVDLQGNADDPSRWKAAFYLRGEELKPAGWPLAMTPAGGRLSMEVWGDWQIQGITAVVGRVHASGLLAPDFADSGALNERLRRLPDLSGQFAWRCSAKGWQWKSDWTGHGPQGEEVLRAQIGLSAVQGVEGELQQLSGRIRGLGLEDLAAATVLWPDQAQRPLLNELAPRGEIPELVFDLALGDGAPQYALAARFENVSTNPWQAIPGLQGLTGEISLDQDSGRLDLDSRVVRMDSPLLRKPVTLDTLTGPLNWRRDNATLRIGSSGLTIANTDLQARLQGGVTLLEDGAGPLVDVQLDYRDLDIGKVSKYLPATALKPRLVEWLDRALVSGRATAGSLVLRGQLADFPFAQDQGLFEARFLIEDAILDYGIGWPRIEELEAEIVFRNDIFQVEAVAGKIFEVDLQQVTARIDGLPHGRLVVRGHAQGPTAAMLRFLNQSPLAGRLGGYLKDMQIQGNGALDLDLAMRFDGSPVEVKGRVNFSEANLNLPNWQLRLERVRGALDFTREGLAAQGMQLLFRGQPMRLDIDTLSRKDGPGEMRFRLRGSLSPDVLLGDQVIKLIGEDLQRPLVKGRAGWDLVLSVPTAGPGGKEGLVLSLSSDLQGIAVNLPKPFGKSPADKRPFTAHVRFAEADRLLLRLDYDPDIDAVLELVGFSAQPRFSRGELRINAGPADLPESRGLAVVARLASFELPALAGGASGVGGRFPWLAAIDAQLGELVVRGLRFPQVQLQVRNQGDALAIDIRGRSLAGRVYLPHTPTPATPLGVELQRLVLTRNKTNEVSDASVPDPRTFPPFWMAVEELILNDQSLGRLRLSMTPHSGGLKLNILELDSDLHHFTARGDWLVAGNRHSSHLQANLHSEELGKTLQALGYPVGVERGETNATLTASWPAPLPSFSVDLLKGELSLSIDKGQLVDVQAGVGRVMGLFSLHSLSRRLALDFSDLFQKGLGFDSIEGTFSLSNGQAYTRDLTLKGPAARIDISGRIGLKDRDYDQMVTVTPRVSSALPIAGTIAGGPAVGAALFLAERFLRQEIDQVARYRYLVTGPWSDPAVKRISASTSSPDRPSNYNRR